MKAVLFYETGGSTLPQILAVFPRHKEFLEKFKEDHVLIGIGPFQDRKGSMAIFQDVATAELFAANDPFVVEGVAENVQIREWQD